MRQELFSDIDPDIKQALQRRKNRMINRDPKEYSKSAFVRVFPLSIIELAANDGIKANEAAEKYVLGMQASADRQTKDPLSSYNDRKTKAGRTYGYNRPIPGITGLSVQYEGFSGKGLVKMQLKGVINTLEELDIYKPILFTPGKYWMLEWGFIPHKEDGIKNNLITIGDVYILYAQKRIGDIFKLAEEHRKITKGTSEVQVAVVNNYEYTLNAAGSFEFTVEFTGNSTLFKNLQSGAIGSGFLSEVATITDAHGNPATAAQIEELSKKVAEGSNPETTSISIIPLSAAANVVEDGVLKIAGIHTNNQKYIETVEEKFKAATPNDFFRTLKSYIIECNKSVGIDTDPLKNLYTKFAGPVAPSPPDTTTALNIKNYGIYYEAEKAPISMGGQKFDYNDFNNEIGPYVTWGWFEDNILNVVYSKNRDTSHPLKWESIDQDGKPLPLNSHKYLYTTTPDKLIIPGRMPEILENSWDSDTGTLSRGLHTEQPRYDVGYTPMMAVSPGDAASMAAVTQFDESRLRKAVEVANDRLPKVDKVFGAYHPIVHDYIRISESALGFDADIHNTLANEVGGLIDLTGLDANELEDIAGYVTDEVLYDEREVLIRTEPDKRGSIRRLVLHYRLIQDSFINAATPTEGLKILLNKIEGMGYKGFWEFDIFEVDDKIGVYEKNSLTAYSDYSIEKVRAQNIDSRKQTDTPPLGEVFVFPTWNRDGGFVINQNLTVKMPSTKMLAMVYGNSLEGKKSLQNKSFGDEDTAQLFSIISAGEALYQKVNVEPGFQGSTIDIVKSIDIGGNIVSARISKKNVLTKQKVENTPAGKDGYEIRYVGEKAVDIGGIFSTGVAIDAYGIMYENVKQVMNHRLSKTWMMFGQEFKKITSRDTRVLDMAELSIKIQGLSGLNWGNQFHTDYIEERFKSEVVFYITKVNHEITEMNWTTEIVGGMRAIFKDNYIKEAVSISEAENRYIDIKLSDADNRFINKMKTNHRNILINSGRMYRETKSMNTQDGMGWQPVTE